MVQKSVSLLENGNCVMFKCRAASTDVGPLAKAIFRSKSDPLSLFECSMADSSSMPVCSNKNCSAGNNTASRSRPCAHKHALFGIVAVYPDQLRQLLPPSTEMANILATAKEKGPPSSHLQPIVSFPLSSPASLCCLSYLNLVFFRNGGLREEAKPADSKAYAGALSHRPPHSATA